MTKCKKNLLIFSREIFESKSSLNFSLKVDANNYTNRNFNQITVFTLFHIILPLY